MGDLAKHIMESLNNRGWIFGHNHLELPGKWTVQDDGRVWMAGVGNLPVGFWDRRRIAERARIVIARMRTAFIHDAAKKYNDDVWAEYNEKKKAKATP